MCVCVCVCVFSLLECCRHLDWERMGEQGLEALHSKKPLESNVEIRENVCRPYEPRVLTVHHPNLKESQSKRVRKRGHRFRREEAGGGSPGGQVRGGVSVVAGLQRVLPQHPGRGLAWDPQEEAHLSMHHTTPALLNPVRWTSDRGAPSPIPADALSLGRRVGQKPNQVSKKIIGSSFFPTVLCWKRKITRSIQNSTTEKKRVPIF